MPLRMSRVTWEQLGAAPLPKRVMMDDVAPGCRVYELDLSHVSPDCTGVYAAATDLLHLYGHNPKRMFGLARSMVEVGMLPDTPVIPLGDAIMLPLAYVLLASIPGDPVRTKRPYTITLVRLTNFLNLPYRRSYRRPLSLLRH